MRESAASAARRRYKTRLLGVFIASFALHAISIGVVFFAGGLRQATLQLLLVRLLTIYGVPLGVVLGGIFGEQGQENSPTRLAAHAFWVAFSLSVIWNILLLFGTAMYIFQSGSPQELLAYLDEVAGKSSFLTVGALAYFFTQRQPAAA